LLEFFLFLFLFFCLANGGCECVIQPDRHHFDNPVYCYPAGGVGGGGAGLGAPGGSLVTVGGLMNNARIRNDLGSNKNNLSNFERAKLGACAMGTTADDDCSEGIRVI